ncbi:MAG: chromosomal replication initiator protein DnaA [Lachnospiraceae bacterium]|nr:chromosomal replication initiator protein DnaA [Lachnospiraceae bacterium]
MINEISENWDLIRERVRNEFDITEVAYNTWLLPLKVHSVENGTINLVIDNDGISHMREYISRKYCEPIKVTAAEFSGVEYEINILTKAEAAGMTPVYEEPAKPARRQASSLGTALNEDLTFETFVVGKNNELAQATALAVASDPGEYGNPLFIYGGAGLGKTHLMQAIGNYALQDNPSFKIIYTTTEAFMSELITAIKNHAQDSFKSKYRNIDMLLMDDIQFISKSESTMEEFFHTFNALYDNRKQVVLSSDKPPKDLAGIEDRLVSRFKAGITVDIQVPDYDTRVAILAREADKFHLTVEEPALQYIADHIVSNIRELKGALNSLQNFARLKNTRHIDLETTKFALRDTIDTEHQVKVTPEMIINAVCEQYNFTITPDDILGNNKSRDISYPRQICMYLCSRYIGLSQENIGRALGNKDHSTVNYGIKKVKQDIENDDQVKKTVDIIVKKLNLHE